MSVTPIEIGPFTEGVNLVDPPVKLSNKELSRCLNWRIGQRGDFYKRPGHNNYGTSPEKINGDNLVNLLLRYYKSDGSKKLIGAAGGLLKFGNDATGAWTNISINGTGASMSSTNLADWMVYKDRLYITDGVRPQRYDGTNDLYAGHFIHAAPTLAPTTTGAMTNGTYKYFVTSVTGDMGEGPKGAEATIVLAGANDGVALSLMAAAPAAYGEVTKKIYRTKVNGTLFYFVASIPTGTTTYNDDAADSALGEEYISSHAPPSDTRFVIMGHDERAYWFGRSGANASLVEVSEVGFPDRILDTGSFFTVSNNDGDILTGAALVPGGIVFFKKNTTWLLRAFGFGLINIEPKEKRGGGVGTTASFSPTVTPGGLIWLSQRGEVFKFDGTNVEEIGRKIASEFRGMTESAMGKIVACYHDYRYQISYDFRGSKGYNWRTLEYDTIKGEWEGPHENGTLYTPSYYSVWDSVLDKGELYWGESRAAGGSYAYGRSELTKTDRGTKFISLGTTGAKPLGGLGAVNTKKVFVHGEFSSDARLSITHIDEVGIRDSVELNDPNAVVGSKWNDGSDWGPDPQVGKWGGKSTAVLEGPLTPASRSRTPIYEISDGGVAVEAKINIIEALVEALPLK